MYKRLELFRAFYYEMKQYRGNQNGVDRSIGLASIGNGYRARIYHVVAVCAAHRAA